MDRQTLHSHTPTKLLLLYTLTTLCDIYTILLLHRHAEPHYKRRSTMYFLYSCSCLIPLTIMPLLHYTLPLLIFPRYASASPHIPDVLLPCDIPLTYCDFPIAYSLLCNSLTNTLIVIYHNYHSANPSTTLLLL